MTMESYIIICAFIHFFWSVFQVFCQSNFWCCFNLIPYAILFLILNNLDGKNRKKRDVCAQTDVKNAPLTKDVQTSTDKLACGDTVSVRFQNSDSAPPTFGEYGPAHFQYEGNSFYGTPRDSPTEVNGTNPFLENATSNENPLVLYQGENEEAPEIYPEEFEVDEPELIEIFQNSANSFSFLDTRCVKDSPTNPFLGSQPILQKSTNPFKRPIHETGNPFSVVLSGVENSVRNASDRIIPLSNQAENQGTDTMSEIDEPEMIDSFNNSKKHSSRLDDFCQNDFQTNLIELKGAHLFKESNEEIAESFCDILDDDFSERSTPIIRKRFVSLPVVTLSKLFMKRKVKKFKSWVKYRPSINNSPSY